MVVLPEKERIQEKDPLTILQTNTGPSEVHSEAEAEEEVAP